MEKSIAAAPDDLRFFTTIRRQFFVISLPLFFQKKTKTYLQTEKNGQLTFEKVKKQKIISTQNQHCWQDNNNQRLSSSENFVKSFSRKISRNYPVNTRYMFELVRMMFVHVVRSFLKQRKRRRGEGEMRSFDEPHFFLNFLKPTLSSMHT